MSKPTCLSDSLDTRGVLSVTLNRPEIRNAFNATLIQELTDVFTRSASDPKVRLVVLRGSGPVFCAGGDLNWMKDSVAFTREQNLDDTLRLTRMFALMNEFPKPVLGGIQGAAIGGGVGLVSICDIAVAEEKTVFSLSEVRLGLIPACIGPFVISKIGASQARALFVSAERFGASRAREIGLVHEIASDPAGIEIRLEQIIENILQCSPNALEAAKKLIMDLSWPEKRARVPDCIRYVSETLADLRVSPEGQEGVKAFLEKRKPSWMK